MFFCVFFIDILSFSVFRRMQSKTLKYLLPNVYKYLGGKYCIMSGFYFYFQIYVQIIMNLRDPLDFFGSLPCMPIQLKPMDGDGPNLHGLEIYIHMHHLSSSKYIDMEPYTFPSSHDISLWIFVVGAYIWHILDIWLESHIHKTVAELMIEQKRRKLWQKKWLEAWMHESAMSWPFWTVKNFDKPEMGSINRYLKRQK